MDIAIYAARKATATDRIVASATALAASLDIAAPDEGVLRARGNDPDNARLFQLEAVADLLEQIAAKSGALPEAKIEQTEATDVAATDETAAAAPKSRAKGKAK